MFSRLLSSRSRHAFWPVLAVAVVSAVVLSVALIPRAQAASPKLVGMKSYYLALGDSLAFGYEPNLDWSHGYAQQWHAYMTSHGDSGQTFVDYGCNGETSYTMINGGCPYWYVLHNYYFGAQLTAAVNFIKNHAGHVSPVSLDMGANDLLPDINGSACAISSTWTTDLANVNMRLTGTILPKLLSALNGTGDLVMMNYYDPYQDKCASVNPNVVTDMATFNADLLSDAESAATAYNNAHGTHITIPVADVYDAFGGSTTQNSCTYTWMCSSYADVHATGGQSGEPGNGYSVIAGAFETATGY